MPITSARPKPSRNDLPGRVPAHGKRVFAHPHQRRDVGRIACQQSLKAEHVSGRMALFT